MIPRVCLGFKEFLSWSTSSEEANAVSFWRKSIPNLDPSIYRDRSQQNMNSKYIYINILSTKYEFKKYI